MLRTDAANEAFSEAMGAPFARTGRMILTGADRFGPFRPRKNDLVVSFDKCAAESDSPLRVFHGEPHLQTFHAVQSWAETIVSGQGCEVRAALFAQIPFLLDWASLQKSLTERFEMAFPNPSWGRVLLHHLPADAEMLAKCYFQSHGCRTDDYLYPQLLRKHARSLYRKLIAHASRLPTPSQRLTEDGHFQKGQFLMLALQVNTTRAMLPVARQLRQRSICPHFLIHAHDSVTQALLRSEGFDATLIESFGRSAITEREKRIIEQEVLKEKALIALVNAVELPGWVSSKDAAARLRATLSRRIGRAYRDALQFRRALSSLAPRAVVYSTRRAFINELLTMVPQAKKIFFLHGIVPETPTVGSPLSVDLALIGSELDAPYVHRCGIDETATEQIGYAQYDHFGDLNHESCSRQLARACPSAEGRPIVVFTSQYATAAFPEWARLRNLKTLIQTARLCPEYFFTIKLHPVGEKVSPSFRHSCPENVQLNPALPTEVALKGAHAAVTYWSTTALEAVLLGTPMIQLNATGLPDYFDLSGELGREFARSAEELAGMLRNLPTALSRREAMEAAFLRRFSVRTDRDAASRAASAIEKLMSAHRSASVKDAGMRRTLETPGSQLGKRADVFI